MEDSNGSPTSIDAVPEVAWWKAGATNAPMSALNKQDRSCAMVVI
jgi:hypothetical protein